MNGQLPPGYRQIQVMGCLATAMVFAFLCLLPWLFVETMQLALSRLHLSGPVATLAVVGILLGSFFNFPIHAIQRDEEQVIDMAPMWGGTAWGPSVARRTTATYIAVNVGGCVVPSLIAIWQLRFLVSTGGWPLTAVAIVAGANIAVCYFVARPIRGIGIGMPWFTSANVVVAGLWRRCDLACPRGVRGGGRRTLDRGRSPAPKRYHSRIGPHALDWRSRHVRRHRALGNSGSAVGIIRANRGASALRLTAPYGSLFVVSLW